MHININGRCIGIETVGNGEEVVYISHAHSDHVRGTNKEVLASPETLSFIQGERKREIKSCKGIENLTLYPSGHMLGSTQILIENGKRVVYTSDFKLRDGFTTPSAEVIECDKLIIDTTYDDPIFNFPEKEIVAEEIKNWMKDKSRVVFGAYKLGKAQELIRLLNKQGITPLVDSKIEKGCSIYRKLGIPLDSIDISTEEGKEKLKDNFVCILPFHKVNWELEKKLKEVYEKIDCALVTGWGIRYNYGIKTFPLSDHAGFDEIIEYVEGSGAKEVVCRFGSTGRIVKELRNRGISAHNDGPGSSFFHSLLDFLHF